MAKIPWSYRIKSLAWKGLDLLFPPVCAGCGTLGQRWCLDCQRRVPRISEPYCETCGIPTPGTSLCDTCTKNPPVFRMMRSWAVFDSPIQNGLHTMKYRGNVSLGEALAFQMRDFVRSLPWSIDVLVPVPLGRKRLQERGYNQVALVAEPLAYFVDLAYEPRALRKEKETRSQVGLNHLQRRENVQNAYHADPGAVKRKSILILDDVATTGSTLSSCTHALMAAGAREVYAITIARALSHHDLSRV